MDLRKLVLFIVEGESDELALGRSLTTVFSKRKHLKVQFGIVRGDITAESEGSPADIKKRVGDCARQYLSKYKLKWSDLDAVVLIADTDGAFVDASAVVEMPSCEKLTYLYDRIICGDAHGVIERNRRKSGCLRVLSRTGSLSHSGKKVRFTACYMSRNLEHALSDYADDASTEYKFKLARQFSRLYGMDDNAFLCYLKTIAPEGSYRESWEYVARDANSLRRGSNLSQVLDFLIA